MSKRSSRTQTPFHRDKREKVDLDMMALVTIVLEEVGKDKIFTTYEEVW